MAREGKKPLNVWLDDESKARLESWVDENGISITAFVEATCRRLPSDRPPRWLADVVSEARLIDSQRRARRRSTQ